MGFVIVCHGLLYIVWLSGPDFCYVARGFDVAMNFSQHNTAVISLCLLVVPCVHRKYTFIWNRGFCLQWTFVPYCRCVPVYIVIPIRFPSTELRQIDSPRLPTKAYIHARTHFCEMGVLFSVWGVYSRNQEKGYLFQVQIPEIFKRVKYLQVSACFHPDFDTLDPGLVFRRYSSQIERNEKYDVHKTVWYN